MVEVGTVVVSDGVWWCDREDGGILAWRNARSRLERSVWDGVVM